MSAIALFQAGASCVAQLKVEVFVMFGMSGLTIRRLKCRRKDVWWFLARKDFICVFLPDLSAYVHVVLTVVLGNSF